MRNRGLILAVIAVVFVAAGVVLYRTGPEVGPPPEPAIEQSIDQSGDEPAPAESAPVADAGVEQPQSAPDSTQGATATGTSVFGSNVPPDLVAEIEAFNDWENPGAAAARQSIIERGSAAAPGVLAALEDVVGALAAYDPANLGDDADEYQALVMKLNHLLGVIGSIGDESHAERLIAIGRRLNPDNMVTGSFYDALDAVGSPERSAEFAAEVIENPSSSRLQLTLAMSRYWLSTPPEIAESALQHVDDDMLLNRAAAYRLAINAGRGDEIRQQLMADVNSLEYTRTGNKQLLYAYALIDEPTAFAAQIEPFRLRRKVERSATKFNRFFWSTPDERIEQLPEMLSENDSELHAAAIQFLLEEGRGDLLEQYRLARPLRPFDMYESIVPGIGNMTHEQRSQYIDEPLLTELEAIEAEPTVVIMSRTTSKVTRLLGYELEYDGNRVTVRRR